MPEISMACPTVNTPLNKHVFFKILLWQYHPPQALASSFSSSSSSIFQNLKLKISHTIFYAFPLSFSFFIVFGLNIFVLYPFETFFHILPCVILHRKFKWKYCSPLSIPDICHFFCTGGIYTKKRQFLSFCSCRICEIMHS